MEALHWWHFHDLAQWRVLPPKLSAPPQLFPPHNQISTWKIPQIHPIPWHNCLHHPTTIPRNHPPHQTNRQGPINALLFPSPILVQDGNNIQPGPPIQTYHHGRQQTFATPTTPTQNAVGTRVPTLDNPKNLQQNHPLHTKRTPTPKKTYHKKKSYHSSSPTTPTNQISHACCTKSGTWSRRTQSYHKLSQKNQSQPSPDKPTYETYSYGATLVVQTFPPPPLPPFPPNPEQPWPVNITKTENPQRFKLIQYPPKNPQPNPQLWLAHATSYIHERTTKTRQRNKWNTDRRHITQAMSKRKKQGIKRTQERIWTFEPPRQRMKLAVKHKPTRSYQGISLFTPVISSTEAHKVVSTCPHKLQNQHNSWSVFTPPKMATQAVPLMSWERVLETSPPALPLYANPTARKAGWSKFEFASFPMQPSPRAELWSECTIIRQGKNADLFEVIALYLLVYCFSNIPFLPINGLFILFGSLYSLSEDESWENWMAATLLWLWSVIFLWGVSLLGWIYCVFAMVHSKRGPFFRTVCLYSSLPRPSAAIFHVGYYCKRTNWNIYIPSILLQARLLIFQCST